MADNENKELNAEGLPVEIDKLPLEKESQDIVNQIIKETDINNLKDLTKLFNITQIKKNALRIIKLQNLRGTIEDQAINRFDKHPDQISDKLLLDYMNTIQDSIDKANQYINQLDEQPLIQINNTKTENNVNINTNNLTKEERDNVINIIKLLIPSVQSQNINKEIISEAEIIDKEENNQN